MYDDFDEYEDYEFEDIGLYEHKRSDKVKWIISFLLIFVLLAGLIGAWVMLLKPENEAPQQDEEVVEEEPGTMDGKVENKKYFIMNAKIYARRFATDCFSDYFNDMAKKSGAGLRRLQGIRHGKGNGGGIESAAQLFHQCAV